MDGYYTWMLVSASLVLLMTAPGLALFYGGMSRSKSVLNMMMMSFTAIGVVGIVYALWGWSMSYSTTFLTADGEAGKEIGKLFSNPFKQFGLETTDPGQLRVRRVPAHLRRHHRRADQRRGRRPPQVLGVAGVPARLGDALLLPARPHGVGRRLPQRGRGRAVVAAARQRHRRRRDLAEFAPIDYAGGTVVHINAGIAGLVLALLLGKRLGFGKEPMKPHNLTLTMIGAGLLWFGWFGFNVGSIVNLDAYDRPRPAWSGSTPRWRPAPR